MMLKQWLKSRASRVAICAAALIVVSTAIPAVASAGKRTIYLNGIDLSNVDVSNQSFSGCEVKFDADGNVHITVKGIEMTTVDGEGTTANEAPKKGTNKAAKKVAKVKKSELGTAPGTYYLIAKPNTRKGYSAPYKVSVYVNDKLIKLVQPDGGMVVMDISKYVGPGVNTARLIAAHELAKTGKASKSIEDTLEIVIGKGEVKKDAVVIRTAYVEYSRNAAETKDFDDKFSFTVSSR